MALNTDSQLQAVKDYIAKHNLEDELSNAVNQAIKEDSDDPYRVISDYLRKFAKDQDEEEDDDDDVIPEGEEVVVVPKGRRQQVAAKKFEAPDNWTAPYYEHTPEDLEFLMDTMTNNKLMKNLTPSDRSQLANAFKKVEIAEGSNIIKQGDAGDMFYILATGECDIVTEKAGWVMKATRGIAFGELALLHNAPRAATVTAIGPCTAFALDEISFKMILMGKAQTDSQTYMGFLKEIDILKGMEETQIREIAGALKEKVYKAETNIICEGEEGNAFYIIRDGSVICTKKGEQVASLKEGQFFGELALLRDDKRAATVKATVDTTVLSMDRASFTRLLGALTPPEY